MNKEWLSIAQCLNTHPILFEKPTYKIKYLNVLEYFVGKYSKEDVFSKELLNVYKEKLLDGVAYSYNVKDIRKAAKGATGLKFKGYKLFSYRYNLLFDCFFINSFLNKEKAQKMVKEIKEIFHSRYHNKINQLFDVLYNGTPANGYEMLSEQLKCWTSNKKHLEKSLRKILITANMSAGKSTLIITLIGKKVNRTQNDACTAKIHFIFNKPFEDDYSYEWDYNLDLNASLKELMEDNPQNVENEISVGTYFRTETIPKERICIIDTPGVNSSLDKHHQELSYDIIKSNDFDRLVCVLNASNIGTFDDQAHLQFLADNVKDRPIVFVVNQLDKFDKDEDDIDECIEKVREDILSYGFENFYICPVSAYAGLLAKKQMYGESLSEMEKIELQMFILKFNDNYSVMKKYFMFDRDESIKAKEDETLNEKCRSLLKKSGVLNLEKILFE